MRLHILASIFLIFLHSACSVDPSSSEKGQNTSENLGYDVDHPVAELNDWLYFSGKGSEGLNTSIPVWPDSSREILLPHRIPVPNTPMWYRCRILTGDSLVLRVSADDGQQVYFQGKRVPAFHPNHFRLWAVQDSAELIIRVLNNAMAGGLRKASLFGSGMYYAIKKANKDRLLLLTQPHPSDSLEILAGPMLSLGPDSIVQLRVQIPGEEPVSLWFSKDGTQWVSANLQRVDTFRVFRFDLPLMGIKGPVNYYFSQGKKKSTEFILDFDPNKRPVRFSAWGDSQGGWEVFSKLVLDMNRRDIEFTIGLGDLVANGSDPDQWQHWHRSLQPLASEIPVYPVPGNHDYDGYYDHLIPELYHHFALDRHYFSWKWGPATFIALDPNEDFPIGIRGRQMDWLEEQFASEDWTSSRWRFILLHQPPYSQSWQGYHGDDFIREIIEREAEARAIDFVLSGHSHAFEAGSRKYGSQTTHFLILGGGGGSLEDDRFSDNPRMDTIILKHHYGLFDLDEQKVSFSLIDQDGKTIFDKVFKK